VVLRKFATGFLTESRKQPGKQPSLNVEHGPKVPSPSLQALPMLTIANWRLFRGFIALGSKSPFVF
jgi:hypothetical protein